MRSCFRGKVQPGKMYDSRPKSSLKYVTGSTLGTGAVNGGFYSELDSASNRGNTLSVCLSVCLYNYVCVGWGWGGRGGGSQPSISLSICLLYLCVCLSVFLSACVCVTVSLSSSGSGGGAGTLNLAR